MDHEIKIWIARRFPSIKSRYHAVGTGQDLPSIIHCNFSRAIFVATKVEAWSKSSEHMGHIVLEPAVL